MCPSNHELSLVAGQLPSCRDTRRYLVSFVLAKFFVTILDELCRHDSHERFQLWHFYARCVVQGTVVDTLLPAAGRTGGEDPAESAKEKAEICRNLDTMDFTSEHLNSLKDERLS